MVIKDGVDFDSLDGEPVHLLFLIAAPDTEDNIHLEVLSKLSVMLMDDNFTKSLKNGLCVDMNALAPADRANLVGTIVSAIFLGVLKKKVA